MSTLMTPTLMTETTQDPRWPAVLRRDASSDGAFFYSVATTGVYCRTSCPARSPNPKNVRFHEDVADAERAGFRACKRCRPDQPPLAERRAAMVAAACRTIEASERTPSLAALAGEAGVGVHHFSRVFKAVAGLTPRQYAAARRARRVREQLLESPSVTDAIYGAGFSSNGRFYEATGEALGMTPSAWRDRGAGESIRFAVGQCSLGAILVAATARGVCAILMGDDPDALSRDLQDRFERAELLGGDAGFEALVARVVGLIEAPGTGLDLPLDVQGTAFQRRVWRALMAIPAGETATYAQIAEAIGAPKSYRAVAGACGANPLAVAIPCHRVIKRDGGLSGYRWGVERKRALLDREAEAVSGSPG